MSPNNTETQRLFFALWPPVELTRELYRSGGEALQTGAGRRVVPENIHLTLVFLGSVNAPFRECAEQAASQVDAAAFTLELDRIGCWPKPGILWAGPAQTPEAMHDLVRQLNAGLSACGHEAERRPFAAHLTLARGAHSAREAILAEPLAWEPAQFHLVQSHTRAAGARYEILRSWPLRSPAR